MKIADIRPDAAMDGQVAAIDRDVDYLQTRQSHFVKVACPACAGSTASFAFERKQFSYYRCQDCATVYMSPRPDAAMLADFYAQSEVYKYWSSNVYKASAAMRQQMLFRPRAQIVDQLCNAAGLSGGVAIEVGASYGFFCEEIRSLGRFSEIHAIEPTPDQAIACRAKGFRVHECSYERAPVSAPADLVASFETIEHLFSPRAFFEWAAHLLRPKGILMITCPNMAGFETLVLGADAPAVDHEHINYFNPRSITRLAEMTGFGGIRVVTPGKLDVEIVEEHLRKGVTNEEKIGPFVSELIASGQETKQMFQEFLQAANLSSHMLLTASRIG